MDESLKQHIERLGWTEQFLDKTGMFARIGAKNWVACLEPFNRFQRILTNKKLPIAQIISPGTQVKFLKSLKHELIGSGSRFSLLRLCILTLSFFAPHRDWSKQCAFEGYIEEQWRFASFPFDEWLTVVSVSGFHAVYTAPDGQGWTINHAVLTNVTQIEIKQRTIGSN